MRDSCLESRTDVLLRHGASGTKQHSGVTVGLLPLLPQRGLCYIVTKIKELGKTTCAAMEDRWA